ncbi:MAG: fibronectin type III domain-containing protein [Clostridiales bacterium]|nr:fibronectin type III domain-containing protein [Clostridiales bacterium]
MICDGKVLVQDTDYELMYYNNLNAGAGSVTVTGINDYTGSTSAKFTIAKASQTLSVSVSNSSLTVGETTTLKASVTEGGGALTYTSGNTSVATVNGTQVTAKAVGTATITVKAAETGNYKAASRSVSIKVGLAKTAITSISNTTGGVKIGWSKVAGASGYYIYRSTSSSGTYTKIAAVSGGSTVTYTNGTSGTYKVASGKTYYYKVVPYAGSTTGAYSSAKGIRYLTAGKISSLINTSDGITIKWSKVSGASGYYIYRGNSKIKTITSVSTVSYTDTAVKSKNGTSYSYYVRPYYKNSSGTVTLASYQTAKTYRLVATSISSLKNSSSKKMTVKWSKKSSVTGYQIQYSTSSSFSSGNKTVNVSGASSTSKTISGLTKKKTYYVRVRTYRTVSGTTYYSAWSSKKECKDFKVTGRGSCDGQPSQEFFGCAPGGARF